MPRKKKRRLPDLWFPMDVEFIGHWKFFRFVELSGLDEDVAIGKIVRLWSWAMKFAPNGDLSHFTPNEIERAAKWEKCGTELVSVLVGSKLVDKRGESIWLHDWEDYGGKLLKEKAKNRERMQRTRGERAPHVQRTSRARSSERRGEERTGEEKKLTRAGARDKKPSPRGTKQQPPPTTGATASSEPMDDETAAELERIRLKSAERLREERDNGVRRGGEPKRLGASVLLSGLKQAVDATKSETATATAAGDAR